MSCKHIQYAYKRQDIKKNVSKTTFKQSWKCGCRRTDSISEMLPLDDGTRIEMWRSSSSVTCWTLSIWLARLSLRVKKLKFYWPNINIWAVFLSSSCGQGRISIMSEVDGMTGWYLLYISLMQARLGPPANLYPATPVLNWNWRTWGECVRSYPASLCLIHTQWQQPAFVGGVRHRCVTLEIWTWSLRRPGVKAISSTPPPVNYWSSVTGAQCPRPVTVKDEGVLALSNEPSVKMPATNDPWAETHLSSVRAMGAMGQQCVCLCVCVYGHSVYIWL